jgi:threonine synthase
MTAPLGAAVRVACAGCGTPAPPGEPFPFRCPNAGDGGDHVMARVLDPDAVNWPDGEERNPFVRYRTLLYAYHLGRGRGMSDEAFVEMVDRVDDRIAAVDGTGFRITPFGRAGELSGRVGCEVWVKDETGQVSGSHKGRHLMGLLLLLEVAERTGLAERDGRRLAIASCGNAALAAAVVAQAGARPLDVFVPTWAEAAVVRRLEDLGATVHVVPRDAGVPGDPTYRALRAAVEEGAVPFTCQGPDNGLTVEGGETMAYELVDAWRERGRVADRAVVQVGGGALASAVVNGLRDAVALGAIAGLPRVHAVQARGGHPLVRAYERVARRALERLGEDASLAGMSEGAQRILAKAETPEVEEVLREAAADRAAFMWPWETEPRSAATGILDDETYDWLAVVRGMLATGGRPVVADETAIEEANRLGREATHIGVDHTGTAGLAGLLELRRRGEVPDSEEVAVLFTGARR